MDLGFTTSIKGFSIIAIVWAHCGAQLSVEGIQFIAGIGVALFLICSGYGLENSYKSNGLKNFWKKRLLGVFLPFWLVELVGFIYVGAISWKNYILDFSFLKPATSYGWFMGYIVVCYVIFYLVKKLVKNFNIQIKILFFAFIIWFILESVFFCDSNIPFLKARQMLSFPFGVVLADNRDMIDSKLSKIKCIIIFFTLMFICLFFMAITQLFFIKELPYLGSNFLSLFTCFPMAIGIIAIGQSYSFLFNNKLLLTTGSISYEIYLIHAFTIRMIKPNYLNMVLFIVITIVLAHVLNTLIRIIKNDRFNSSYTYKK